MTPTLIAGSALPGKSDHEDEGRGADPSWNIIMRPEIYVTAALVGAGVFTAVNATMLPLYVSAGLGVAAAFAVRGGALWFGVKL